MTIKQSDLNYLENTKSCVFVLHGSHDFYWERGGDAVLITDVVTSRTVCKVYIDSSKPSEARRAIIEYIKGHKL